MCRVTVSKTCVLIMCNCSKSGSGLPLRSRGINQPTVDKSWIKKEDNPIKVAGDDVVFVPEPPRIR